MRTLNDIIRPMIAHRDRDARRLTLLSTEPSKGEQEDREIKLTLEAELDAFTHLIDHMLSRSGDPLDIIRDAMTLCLNQRDAFDPTATMEDRAQWAAHHGAYIRMTMLDPAFY